MSYNELKNKLLDIKKQIDEEIKEKGITQNLINYEEDLNKIYQKVKKVWENKQNKKYINFNYFTCKAVISLAKGYHYVALKEWLEGFKNFIEYTNQVKGKGISKWRRSIDYYRLRLKLILQKSRIEIFGNLPEEPFNEIIDAFKEVISASSTNALSSKIQEILIDAIDSIVTNSTEIYTDIHLSREKNLIDLLKEFEDENNYIIGMKSRIEFILLKKELHYYLREILRKKEPDKSNLERVINQMKESAGKEKNNFKKVNNRENVDFKKFLSEIDVLTSKYYYALWSEGELIKAIKYLEEIFSKIRKNLNIIKSVSMFQYFVNEFLFLQNYIKLLLVANDFKNYAKQNNVYEWQKELSNKVYNDIISLAKNEFKYIIPQNIERTILVVERSSAGKFFEFIIFYFLKELLSLKEEALQGLSKFQDISDDIRNFIKIILNSEVENVKWSYKTSDTDIDIFIPNKCAIFLKTGIIGSNDRKRIRKELAISKNYNVFYLLDIAKNLDVVKEIISSQDNRIKLIDIGNFLNEIYEFTKEVGVQMELSKSSIESLTGFYSGG